MNTEMPIAKQLVRILHCLNDNIEPTQINREDATAKALYSVHKLSPAHVVITCPVMHDNFFYISENCKSVFGYDINYMVANFKQLEKYVSQIHDSDIKDFKNCLQYFESFMKQVPPEDQIKIRITFYYRFRAADGAYIYLEDEKATLCTGEGKIVHYSLVRRMPDNILFSGVKMIIHKEDQSLEKIVEYKPASHKTKLSGRENELVTLIKKGLTTKEIASHLSISHHTVRNIKSKLFEKYSVNNSIELLNMTG